MIGMLFLSNINGQRLEEFQWENRILIIETPNKSNERYQSQMNEFVNLEVDLLDRKMLIIEIVADQYKTTNYLLEQNDTEWKELESSSKKSTIETFKVTLIGLDGSIKLEQKDILTKEELFRIIDSMPMRKSELRNKTKRQ